MSQQRRISVWGLLGFLAVAVIATAAILAVERTDRSYRFVSVDHPVDMWDDGKDRWAYFSIGKGTPDALAVEARSELIPLGFTEDTSAKPWIRFVRGIEEVVICHHHEFEVNASPVGRKLEHHRPPLPGRPVPTSNWPCVLVKNGPGTKGTMMGFQIKKLIYGW